LRIPDGVADEQVLFLSDIPPTGYQAALNAGVKAGSTVAIFGAGPVGLMSAACCRLLGAETIFMVDHLHYRLDYARRAYGVTPIDFREIEDPADYILAQTSGGRGCLHRGGGFEAEGSALESALTAVKLEGSSGAIRQCIAAAASRRRGQHSGGLCRFHPWIPAG
jgi:threonine dehydrogenase-like Zn-dependent dehydrogenase